MIEIFGVKLGRRARKEAERLQALDKARAAERRLQDLEMRITALEEPARVESLRMTAADYDSVESRRARYNEAAEKQLKQDRHNELLEVFDSMDKDDAFRALVHLLETREIRFIGFRLTREKLSKVRRALQQYRYDLSDFS